MAARGNVTLTVKFDGEDKVSVTVDKVSGKVEALGKKGKKFGQEWADAYNEVNAALSNMLGKLGAVHDFVSSGQEAANANLLFARTWDDATAALERFRASTYGTIDDTTLQQRAQAMALMGLTAAQAADAMAAAFKLAAATGRDTDQVLQAVLGGIRGEVDGLKQLGVVVDLGAAYELAGQKVGKTSKELSAAEKAAVRTAVVLGDLAKKAEAVDMDGFAFSTQQSATAWANLKSNVSVVVAELSDPAFQIAAKAIGAIADEAGRQRTELDKLKQTAIFQGAITQLNEDVQAGVLSFAAWRQRMEDVAIASGKTEAEARTFTAALAENYERTVALDGALGDASEGLRMFVTDMREVQTAEADVKLNAKLQEWTEGFEALGRVASRVGATGAEALTAFGRTFANEATKPKGGQGGDKKSRLDEWDLLVAGLYGTTEANARMFAETADAITEAADEAYAVAQAETVRQRGLWQIRQQIEREGRMALLEEGDHLGQLDLEHEYRLQEIRRTAIDYEQADLLTQLENQRWAGEQRQELRDREQEQLRLYGDSILGAAERLAQVDKLGIGAGLGRAAAYVAQNWQALSKNSPQAIAALGNVAAAGIKSEAAVAAIRVITETAAGIAAAVTPGRQWEAAGHFQAAAMYAIAEAMGGSGRSSAAVGGGGFGVRSARVAGGQGSGGGGGGDGSTVVINYGVLGMGNQQASRSLAVIQGHGAGSGFETPGAGRL